VVEGSWKGDISSVHCDLLEGGGQYGRAVDWWDRGAPAVMSWSERTFSQQFVKDEGRQIEDPIDPGASYAVVCLAQFSGAGRLATPQPWRARPRGKRPSPRALRWRATSPPGAYQTTSVR
jgi:hypothetical protein